MADTLSIILISDHRYPAAGKVGAGIKTRSFPSGAGQQLFDLLALGLSKLGHEVHYFLKEGVSESLPDGITAAEDFSQEVDIAHGIDPVLVKEELAGTKLSVATCHSSLYLHESQNIHHADNWIHVSRSLAQSYGSNRFVYNGIDPDSLSYCEEKGDYLLFIASMNRWREKGLLRALELSQRADVDLVVAGGSDDAACVEEVSKLCRQFGAEYFGDVRGQEKAELFAQARALILPTTWFEGCPLVIIEALFSGTPVIVSDDAACKEITIPDVGFVCSTDEDYLDAVRSANSISPRRCREFANEEFHYMKMAENYVKEYQKEIGR